MIVTLVKVVEMGLVRLAGHSVTQARVGVLSQTSIRTSGTAQSHEATSDWTGRGPRSTCRSASMHASSWLAEDREGLRVHRHLTEAASEWGGAWARSERAVQGRAA